MSRELKCKRFSLVIVSELLTKLKHIESSSTLPSSHQATPSTHAHLPYPLERTPPTVRPPPSSSFASTPTLVTPHGLSLSVSGLTDSDVSYFPCLMPLPLVSSEYPLAGDKYIP